MNIFLAAIFFAILYGALTADDREGKREARINLIAAKAEAKWRQERIDRLHAEINRVRTPEEIAAGDAAMKRASAALAEQEKQEREELHKRVQCVARWKAERDANGL